MIFYFCKINSRILIGGKGKDICNGDHPSKTSSSSENNLIFGWETTKSYRLLLCTRREKVAGNSIAPRPLISGQLSRRGSRVRNFAQNFFTEDPIRDSLLPSNSIPLVESVHL